MRKIYLLTLNGHHYAVWKDEVESVRKVETIHQLPFSPACIVGLAIIDKKSTAMADLAVLIGLPPLDRNSQTQALLVNGQKKDIGFVVTGDITEISIPEESIHPIPDYVATPEILSCIIYREKPVPLIDTKALFQHINSHDLNPSIPKFTIPRKNLAPPSTINSIKLFSVGGEIFAFPADIVTNIFSKPFVVNQITMTPGSLKGIFFTGKTMIPVIDLSEKMNSPVQGNATKLLEVDLSGNKFGFLIDDELETLHESDFTIHSLPILIKSPLINAAAVHNQEIIPLVNPMVIISHEPYELDNKSLTSQYLLDSDFDKRFNHEEVEIVEFMLLGEQHALPKSEVEDILPIAPFRQFADLQSLVIGIIEYQDTILPVLDLALVFGRRSLIDNAGKMVLINNGKFRAFVITQAVHLERTLPMKIQKKIPISLPNRLVYGCYPDGNIVRLIINVGALAVNFDKIVVREFLPSLTEEMAASAAEIIPALLPTEEILRLREIMAESKPEKTPQAQTDIEKEHPEQESKPLTSPQKAEQPIESECNDITDRENAQKDEPMRLEPPPESSSVKETADLPENSELPQHFNNEEILAKSLAEKLNQLDETAISPEKTEEIVPGQETDSIHVQNITATVSGQSDVNKKLLEYKKQAASKAKKQQLILDAAAEKERNKAQTIIQEKQKREQEDKAEKERVIMRKILERQKQKELLRRAEEKQLKLRKETAKKTKITPQQGEEPPELEEALLAKKDAEIKKFEKEQQDKDFEQERFRILNEFREKKRPDAKDNKRLTVLLSLILILLIDIFIFFGIPERTNIEPAKSENDLIEESNTDNDIKTPQLTASTAEEAVRLSIKPTNNSQPKNILKNLPPKPLSIIIPDNIPIKTHIYKVKKGDTLWEISIRFTGTPYNYPFVAQKNDIVNPDLIFPGQQILLIRNAKQ